MASHPTGDQWSVHFGDQELVVVEVGGGLRTYSVGGVDVLAGYGADEPCVAGRGQILVPWPNRIRDGKYTFAGREHVLSLSEPAKGNASHGLVRWQPWTLAERGDTHVAVETRLHPQPGWDWSLDLLIRYELSEQGLAVTSTARNVDELPAPYGYGAHPYVSIGDLPADVVRLHVPADRWLRVDAERSLPEGIEDVADTDRDFREARALGDTSLDTAYTSIHRDRDGRWTVSLEGLLGGTVRVWGDEAFPWLQVFTGRATSDTEGTNGIAVEPMTCPPDAFNSGDSLVVLQPGEEWSGQWGIRLMTGQ